MSTARDGESHDREIAAEQAHVTTLHLRLDEIRAHVHRRLTEALAASTHNPQAIGERDAAVALYTQRLAALDAADFGLCFGRLDLRPGPDRTADEPRYIGRIGLPNDDGGEEPALVDWRAPAAQPFYTATALNDLGVVRRRHLRTRGRTVVGFSDEVLDVTDPDAGGASGLTGEAALLAALTATRTGRMTDIVRTIQAEQDRIIRADHRGVLVVQGGPGTGKTAVALHRAAYLLYTHRERLARSGLLIVGPSRTFLGYIAEVLPSLGETGVLLADLASLRPGLEARGEEAPEVAEVKGRLVMADVVAAAVHNRQQVPKKPVEVDVEGTTLRLAPGDISKARTHARRQARQHNPARPFFARRIIDVLARKHADAVGADVRGGANLLDAGDLAELRREVASSPAVHALIDRLWPRLTAERLLREFYASPAQIEAATKGWAAEDRARLHRSPGVPWTPADVPLLEEADELLGVDDAAERRAAHRERQRRRRHAQETLDLLHGSRSHDADTGEASEELSAVDLLSAEALAERHEEVDTRSTAERAAADRTWTFGHVIVDEAQELSAMAWRTVLRRVPTRSMTVVGDVAQTGSLAGATSWAQVLEPHLDRGKAAGWRLEELTINYRTPAEIMAVAAGVLAETGAGTAPPRSVRSTGVLPHAVPAEEQQLPKLAAETAVELTEAAGGTLAVLVPPSRVAHVAEAVRALLPETSAGDGAELTGGAVVLPPAAAKGLEFDAVVVVDPAGIVAEGVRGWNDLYVAMTRATQRLAVVHPGELPEALSGVWD